MAPRKKKDETAAPPASPPEAVAPSTPPAETASAVAPEIPSDQGGGDTLPRVSPPPASSAPERQRAPRYFTVHEHITPAEDPTATRQYVAGQFYEADEYLSRLWRAGNAAVEPYHPEGN